MTVTHWNRCHHVKCHQLFDDQVWEKRNSCGGSVCRIWRRGRRRANQDWGVSISGLCQSSNTISHVSHDNIMQCYVDTSNSCKPKMHALSLWHGRTGRRVLISTANFPLSLSPQRYLRAFAKAAAKHRGLACRRFSTTPQVTSCDPLPTYVSPQKQTHTYLSIQPIL